MTELLIRLIFEKTSKLLNSNIIVAKQYPNSTLEKIKKTIHHNNLINIFLMMIFCFQMEKMNFFYYEDKFGGLKLPKPNVNGQFQLENISTAIATLRILDIKIKDHHIKNGSSKNR